ncbi:group I intron-associated PD-(D/E)XK endonuclease [Dactylosporangium sp. McL0621]|uniref:group I intron-associated PD-(D/E)XK endonuclease n=1 Tax=Dactylosporangium sp. McL0621 TaxID=3415678 RepID=UPI003CE6C612
MNRKQQGDLGVAMAIAYYTRTGYAVSVPLTDNTRYDLIIDGGERLLRVQVKTTGFQRLGRHEVRLNKS